MRPDMSRSFPGETVPQRARVCSAIRESDPSELCDLVAASPGKKCGGAGLPPPLQALPRPQLLQDDHLVRRGEVRRLQTIEVDAPRHCVPARIQTVPRELVLARLEDLVREHPNLTARHVEDSHL